MVLLAKPLSFINLNHKKESTMPSFCSKVFKGFKKGLKADKPIKKIEPRYAWFSGSIVGKAYRSANDELHCGEEPLSDKYILAMAEECGLRVTPPLLEDYVTIKD